ncbi:MAG: glycosyltransferase family 9 protein [Lentisphaeria bacterium]|nr:glycosyltransferase family 9 protein [Lentisphaeria bacterium]
MKDREKILIYHVGGIGDTLAALPAFRMIRRNFPDAELHLLNIAVVKSLSQAELYEHDPLFARKTFLHSGGRLRFYFNFLTALLKCSYSALYCFSPDPPRMLITLFRLLHGRMIFHCTPNPKQENIMLAEGYLRKLESFGLTRDKGLFEFPSTPEENDTAERLLREQQTGRKLPLLVFGIGGKKEVCRWPLERYDELMTRLRAKFDFIPVYIGGPDDRPDAECLKRKYGGIFLFDTPCRSLRNTIAFLRHCSCYIGNDTGSLHLAATAGIPCAGIFSAHNLPPMQWHPFSADSFILRHEQECSGCQLRACRFGYPARCLAAVTVDELFDALVRWNVFARTFGTECGVK